jgi:UDPglucose 6-dehydrogenase
MKICVIGMGYVGLVTAVCFAEHKHEVVCLDSDKEKIAVLLNKTTPFYEPNLDKLFCDNYSRLSFTSNYKTAIKTCDVIFICVGTPQSNDGLADLSYLKNVLKSLVSAINKDKTIIIKSTVPVGTNERIDLFFKKNCKYHIEVISNPEFLSQGSAVENTLHAKRIIVGTLSNKGQQLMHDIYDDFGSPMLFTSLSSSEMIKYASNDFLALKISYINDIANICELTGANIDDVKKGMSMDSRIGGEFLNAGIGYGGSCFTKDTKALYYSSLEDYAYKAKTIKASIEVNEEQKNKLFYEAKKLVASFKGKKVAILGLTFKPNTDAINDAPSINIVNLLLEDNANIICYDPCGINNFKKLFGDKVRYSNDISLALKSAEIVFILTEWNTIKNIDYSLLQNKLIFDGRNVLEYEKCNNFKIYYSIGRKPIIN